MTVRCIAGLALACLLAGCGSDVVPELPPEDASVGDGASDVSDAAPDGVVDSAGDTSIADGASDAMDAPPLDTSAGDTTPADAPKDVAPEDAAGATFACGSETCGKKFQFCRRATSPGICPAVDSGVCPAGCPGCPPLSEKCESMPAECMAFPSCACILAKICSTPSAGECTEKDGAYTAGCKGV